MQAVGYLVPQHGTKGRIVVLKKSKATQEQWELLYVTYNFAR